MRMRPILFNTEMVQAILEGRKTVTRRVVKTKNAEITGRPNWGGDTGHKYWFNVCINRKTATTIQIAPPFEPGDILYVRETWSWLTCGGKTCNWPEHYECNMSPSHRGGCFVYKATHETGEDIKWKPSIHMPKEAARIFLRVKSVRVERLKDITEKQALSEGIEPVYLGDGEFAYAVVNPDALCSSPKVAFSSLWNSTIKTADLDKYGWAANPWVWVIEFERCEKTQEV